jgi:hypothetical protein
MQSPEPIMQFFAYQHLPAKLQVISALFHDLAWKIHETTERSPERSVCLRKLLEAKDAGVRAAMYVRSLDAEQPIQSTRQRQEGQDRRPLAEPEGGDSQAGAVRQGQEGDDRGSGEGE